MGFGRISRRQFIAGSTAAGFAGAILGHDAIASTLPPTEGNVTLRASGNAQQGFGVDVLFEGTRLQGTKVAESFRHSFITATAAWKTG
jgi:hypothetical protein